MVYPNILANKIFTKEVTEAVNIIIIHQYLAILVDHFLDSKSTLSLRGYVNSATQGYDALTDKKYSHAITGVLCFSLSVLLIVVIRVAIINLAQYRCSKYNTPIPNGEGVNYYVK